MLDGDPPLLTPAPPSRLERTLRTLRSPFRPGSPFHFASLKRTGFVKSSVSDSEIARDERTMRKKNKKRTEAIGGASRSTDSSPTVEKKKPGSLLKRMSSLGKRRGDSSTPTSLSEDPESEIDQVPRKENVLIHENVLNEPQTSDSDKKNNSQISTESDTKMEPKLKAEVTSEPELKTNPDEKTESEVKKEPSVQTESEIKEEVETKKDSEQKMVPENPEKQESNVDNIESTNNTNESPASPEPPFITLAVEHPVAMRAFSKEAWKRRRKPEIVKPVEEPSPGNALKRRIAFVAQASVALSEDHDDDDDDDDEVEEGGGEVGSLEEAVALARQRLAMAAHSPAPPHSSDNNETEEEGCADTTDAPDTMPAYGDLIEPESKADSEDVTHAPASAERREHLYKILVIGELGTGKTSIIKRYVHQFFSQHYRATIGVDFALKVLNWDANTVIRLQLWDIAGQERFGNMTRVYYKEAVGAFIVFDVSRVATFDAVVKWKNDLDTKVQLADGSPIPCILLANKCDQQKEGIINSPAKMDEYCREKGFAGWFETSAKENINIEEAARSLVHKILLNDKLLQSNDKDGEKFALDHKIANGENNRDPSTSKSCAC
ncbi:unnamed protein product, partial [Brenthis ino]